MKLFLTLILVFCFLVEGHQHHQHDQGHDHSHHQGHDHSHHHQGDNHQHHQHQHHHHTDQTHKHQQIQDEPAQPIQPPREKLLDFFNSCQKEVDEWIHIPKSKSLQSLLQQCSVFSNADYILQFYSSLANLSSGFSKQHIDLMIKQFKKTRTLPQVLSCITKQRQYQNEYLQQNKKYKYLAQFISRYPLQAKDALPKHHNYKQIGKKFCYFFKALFEYYYLEVLNPSGTLSTEFLRALTVRSAVFEHEDIAYCIAIQSVGQLSGDLQEIDINNIYLKIPEIYTTLRFLKLKQHCRDAHHRKLISNLHNSLQGLDMFKIMFKDYEPFVEIATEKMVQTQIRLLARKFADMIANREQYLEYSRIAIEDTL